MNEDFQRYTEEKTPAIDLLMRISDALERQTEKCELSPLERIERSIANGRTPCDFIIGPALSRDEIRDVRDCCQEIQMRMLAGLFLASDARETRAEPEARLLERLSKERENTAICHTESGLTFANLGSLTVLLLPHVKEKLDSEAILDSLIHVYDQTALSSSWLIDCSMVETMSLSLLGSLVGYQQMFRDQGRNLHFCWVKDSVLPSAIMKRFVNRCNLVRSAMHWFSREWVTPKDLR